MTDDNQVGRQYIEDTAEVKEAKARFFKFFQFAVDGLLYKWVLSKQLILSKQVLLNKGV